MMVMMIIMMMVEHPPKTHHKDLPRIFSTFDGNVDGITSPKPTRDMHVYHVFMGI